MKILFINCNPDLSYFTKRGLNIKAEVVNLELPLFPLMFSARKDNGNGKIVDFYTPNPSQYLSNKYKNYDYSAIVVGIDYSKYGEQTKYAGGYAHWDRMANGMFWSTVRLDNMTNNYIVHELHHLIGSVINIVLGDITPKDYMDSTPVNGVMMPYYKNFEPDAPDGNHAYTWNLFKPFLEKLNKLEYMETYKYFSKKEIETYKLNPKLWSILDKAREIAGVPFVVSSGLRSEDTNKKVGGKSNSAHLRGLAADLYIKDPFKRGAILVGLLNFKSEIFIEIAKSHIHVDIDITIHKMGQVIVEDDD